MTGEDVEGFKIVDVPVDEVNPFLDVECDEEEYCCPISGELMSHPYILKNCGHSFQGQNIKKWLQNKNKCPLCNKEANLGDLMQNWTLKTLIPKKAEEIRRARGDTNTMSESTTNPHSTAQNYTQISTTNSQSI